VPREVLDQRGAQGQKDHEDDEDAAEDGEFVLTESHPEDLSGRARLNALRSCNL
jgi:hypothetical protein